MPNKNVSQRAARGNGTETVRKRRTHHKSKAKPRRVKSLQKYLKAYGKGRDAARLRDSFATRLHTSSAYLIAIAWGYRLASPELAIKIEHGTHGLVPREDLRPDIEWAQFAPRAQSNSAIVGAA